MNIEKIKQKTVEISAKDDTVTIKGEIDQENSESFLNSFFTEVLAQMDDVVIFDIKELKFLNSAGIKAIVSFIRKRKKGSRIIIKSNPTSTWQRTSLKIIANQDEAITIE